VRMLEGMGAKIDGAGTSTIEVEGVTSLTPTSHVTVPDRIVAGTFAMGAVMTRGDVTVRGARPEHLEMLLDKMVTCGATVVGTNDGFRVSMETRPRSVDVVTLPYPGFPTDFLPMIIGLNSVAEGTSMVTENVFEGRFRFIQELVRLGADIRTDGHRAVGRTGGRDRHPRGCLPRVGRPGRRRRDDGRRGAAHRSRLRRLRRSTAGARR
jgi:UDP-N-acetylglucosamine 1-carboxyvinyltransferase